jgi:hypothetical protein
VGQYWLCVNLDKKEYLEPFQLGTGMKLWEQLANFPSAGTALTILLAAMPEPRGGGDFDLENNWHGPERTLPQYNMDPGPMPKNYPFIARETIGRWAGDRIAFVGDYAEDTDLPEEFHASEICAQCNEDYEGNRGKYLDITPWVKKVIEHELRGKFVDEHGHGIYQWVDDPERYK